MIARRLPVLSEDLDPATMPRTRADCLPGGVNAARPCPYYGCRHHLGLEVNRDTGHLRVAIYPEDLGSVPETCSLDVSDLAAQGDEVTLDEVGRLLGGVTRERVRQVEAQALRKLARRGGAKLLEHLTG